MRRQAAVFVGATVLLGAAVCAYSGWDLTTRPLSWEWIVLLTLTAVAGWATLRFPDLPISYSVSDTFSIIAALIVGPSAGALTAALEGLVLSYRMLHVRRSMYRVLFNMACLATATWVAGKVFFVLAGSQPFSGGPAGALRLLLLLAAFGFIHFGLNSGIVAIVIGLERRAPILPIWRDLARELWVSSLGGVFAAMLMLVLARNGTTLGTLILIAPLPVIIHVTLRHVLGRAEDQIGHLGKMNTVYLATIEALAQAVDAKDHVTHDHVRRVQENSLRLAHALGVRDEKEIQALKAASLLHDIGKIAIPEHILNKPGRLTVPEFEIMKRHAAIGADILAVIGFPYPLVPIVRHHHESWDGSGYPDGIAGEQIPIGARILQVVDCFDALTSDRPYRPRLENAEALQIVADRSGTMYDPQVVAALVELHTTDAVGLAVEALPASASQPGPAVVATPEQILVGAGEQLSLEAFFDLGRALCAPVSAAHVGDTLWSHLRDHIPGSAFVLYVYEPATDALAPAFRSGEPTVAAGTRVPLGDRLSGWVAAAGQTIVNSDARLDLDPDVRDRTTLQSALAVPVSREGRTCGVLAFYSRRANAFDERHQRLAEAAAYVAASALHTIAPRLTAVAV
jgi:putative nucleotidyltransferase with HDIG domain